LEHSAANPFASPDLDDIDFDKEVRPKTLGAGRWVGLSALSGMLIFAAYMMVCFGLYMIPFMVQIFFRGDFSYNPMAIYFVCFSLIGGLYGGLFGASLGSLIGILSYRARSIKVSRLLNLAWGTIGFSIAFLPGVAVILLGIYQEALVVRPAIFLLSVMGIGCLFASIHLVRNIHHFLLQPFQAQTEP